MITQSNNFKVVLEVFRNYEKFLIKKWEIPHQQTHQSSTTRYQKYQSFSLSEKKNINIIFKKLQQHLILVIFTLIVDKLSWEDLKRLALESDFGLLFLNFGIEIPPVIKFEVDLDNSFISDMVDRSITDLDIFFRADGVKLLSRTFRAASVSNVSGSISGHIYIQ